LVVCTNLFIDDSRGYLNIQEPLTKVNSFSKPLLEFGSGHEQLRSFFGRLRLTGGGHGALSNVKNPGAGEVANEAREPPGTLGIGEEGTRSRASAQA
jgi:hypothetical protein